MLGGAGTYHFHPSEKVTESVIVSHPLFFARRRSPWTLSQRPRKRSEMICTRPPSVCSRRRASPSGAPPRPSHHGVGLCPCGLYPLHGRGEKTRRPCPPDVRRSGEKSLSPSLGRTACRGGRSVEHGNFEETYEDILEGCEALLKSIRRQGVAGS